MVHYVLEMVLIAAGLSISSSVGGRRKRTDEKVRNLRVGELHLLQGGEETHDALALRLFSIKEPNYWWLLYRKRHDIYGTL